MPPAADSDEQQSLQHVVLNGTPNAPIACFSADEAVGLTLDGIPKWRTAQPLAPLPTVPRFGTAWSSSSTVAVWGPDVLTLDEAAGDLVVLSATTLGELRRVHVGKAPAQLLIGPDGAAYVSLRGDAAVARVAAGSTTAVTIPIGVEPLGLALTDAGDRLFVAVAGERRVAVVTANTGATLPAQGFAVPGRPRSVTVVDLGGTLRIVVGLQNGPAFVRHVAALGDGRAGLHNREQPLRTRNPGHAAADGQVPLASWRVLSGAVQPATGLVLLPHVLAFSGDQAASDDAPAGGGEYAMAPAASCSGTPIRPLEPTVSAIGHGEVAVRSQRAVLDPHTGRQLLARFDQPSAIAHHRRASLAFVTAAGTDNVMVLNTALDDPMAAPLGEIRVGAAPDGIAISTDGQRAYVRDSFGLGISELNLATWLAFVSPTWLVDEQGRPNAPRMGARFDESIRAVTFADDPLGGRAQEGRRIFFSARDPRTSAAGRFACASCHLEGGDDKQVWRIGSGPRQTPALAGRLADTAPYNWKGSEHELLGNMRQTVGRMGGLGLPGAAERALQTYLLDGLRAPPNRHRADASNAAARARGAKLFFDPDIGCAGCHPPPSYTDGKQHIVATVPAAVGAPQDTEVTMHCPPEALAGASAPESFDTPSLRDVHLTAPYLHDGSAATLVDVLARTAGQMGNTAAMTPAERADLVAFLQTL